MIGPQMNTDDTDQESLSILLDPYCSVELSILFLICVIRVNLWLIPLGYRELPAAAVVGVRWGRDS